MSGLTKEQIAADVAAAATTMPFTSTIYSANFLVEIKKINRYNSTATLTALLPSNPPDGTVVAFLPVYFTGGGTLTISAGAGDYLWANGGPPYLPLRSSPLPPVFYSEWKYDSSQLAWQMLNGWDIFSQSFIPDIIKISDSSGNYTSTSVDPNSLVGRSGTSTISSHIISQNALLARLGSSDISSVDMALFGGAFVYKPSALIPAPGQGRLFSDWPSLRTAVLTTVGPQVIWFDETVALVTEGTLDCQDRIALAARKGVVATVLSCGNGTTGNDTYFSNVPDVYGSLTIKSNNFDAPVIHETVTGKSTTFHDGGLFDVYPGMQPAYLLEKLAGTTTSDLYFNGRGNTIKQALAPDTASVAVKGGGVIRIRLQGQKGTIEPNSLACLDGSALGSKVQIFDYGNPNGLVSNVQNALTGSFGGLEYPNFAPEVFHFQGDLSAAVADDCLISNFVLSLATSKNVPGVIATPDPEVEHIVSHENQLRQIAWISDSVLDATTELEILVDGVVVLTTGATVPLIGRVGTQTLLPFNPAPPYVSLVVKGPTVNNRVAVRYRAGTVPGKISVRIQ